MRIMGINYTAGDALPWSATYADADHSSLFGLLVAVLRAALARMGVKRA